MLEELAQVHSCPFSHVMVLLSGPGTEDLAIFYFPFGNFLMSLTKFPENYVVARKIVFLFIKNYSPRMAVHYGMLIICVLRNLVIWS